MVQLLLDGYPELSHTLSSEGSNDDPLALYRALRVKRLRVQPIEESIDAPDLTSVFFALGFLRGISSMSCVLFSVRGFLVHSLMRETSFVFFCWSLVAWPPREAMG